MRVIAEDTLSMKRLPTGECFKMKTGSSRYIKTEPIYIPNRGYSRSINRVALHTGRLDYLALGAQVVWLKDAKLIGD